MKVILKQDIKSIGKIEIFVNFILFFNITKDNKN